MIWALFTVLVLLQRAVAYDYAFILSVNFLRILYALMLNPGHTVVTAIVCRSLISSLRVIIGAFQAQLDGHRQTHL